MASRTPEWVEESFNSFSAGAIPTDELPGKWLSVRTDTPGKHRLTEDFPLIPPAEHYADGLHVVIEGPGIVVFRLNSPVQGLVYTLWTSGGTIDVDARYFGEWGETIQHVRHRAAVNPDFGVGGEVGAAVIGVEISLVDTHTSAVCVDNFFSMVPTREKLASLKKVKEGRSTLEAWMKPVH